MKFTSEGATILENEDDWETVYFDWVNNFLTVERFAEYYGWSIEQATNFIHEARADFHTD